MSELIDIDVGGDAESSVHPLVNKPSLANIPFRWMVRQCLGSKAEISFNSSALKDIGIQPVPANNAEVQDETFINHDEGDAVCKLHSPFKSINAWWVLELIPMRRNFPPIEDGKVIEGKPWKRKIQSVFLWSLGAVLLAVFSIHLIETIASEAVTYGPKKRVSIFTLLSRFAWTIQRQSIKIGRAHV